jgi:integrase
LALEEVTPALVNAFLAALKDEGRHYDKTVKGYRDAICCVWRAAWEAGLTPHRPERVKTIRVRRKVPSAWTIEEVRRLAKTAESLPGSVHGLPVARALWFAAYVHLLWCTGLRVGDLLRLSWEQVYRREKNAPSVIVVTQNKTNHPLLCQFSARADRLAESIRLKTDSPLVMPWPGARCILDRWFCRLVLAAGIRPGGTRRIRRAGASEVEREQPGMAGRFLGHLTPGLAAKHYLDPAITNSRPVTPPEL